jgi:KDO2-lipid IV(A) lauroyltransferase
VLKFAALWLLVRVAGRLPRRVLYVAADAFGTAAWAAFPRLRTVSRDHAQHVLGPAASKRDLSRTARSCVRTAARYYADFARAAHAPAQETLDAIEAIEGVNHFFEAYDRGCGVIVCSAHLGNPEFLTRAVAALGFPMVVLTEPLSPPRVHDFVHQVRQAENLRFVPADMAGVRAALAHVRQGGILALLVDRDVLGNGRPVPFFGEPAALPTGAVELALRTGAPLVPAFVRRTAGGRFRMTIEPQIELSGNARDDAEVERGMLRLATALEHGIRLAPGQWFPLQPIWRAPAR